MSLNNIPKKMHGDIIQSFWTMLRECETKADDNNDPVLKIWVEGWYRQWCEMSESEIVREPIWATRRRRAAFLYSIRRENISTFPHKKVD